MSPKARYQRLVGEETPWRPSDHPSWTTRPKLLAQIVFFAIFVICVAVLSYWWGAQTRNSETDGVSSEFEWLVPPGAIDTSFRYQKSFSVDNGNETDSLWRSIFPKTGGYVQHPSFSPELQCFAVYHQLHCLDAIRGGYWAAVNGHPPSHHARPAHVRHCIDYLRQSLMCNADTNLEPFDPVRLGVTGFNTTKKCRDYSRLTAWASEWSSHS